MEVDQLTLVVIEGPEAGASYTKKVSFKSRAVWAGTAGARGSQSGKFTFSLGFGGRRSFRICSLFCCKLMYIIYTYIATESAVMEGAYM